MIRLELHKRRYENKTFSIKMLFYKISINVNLTGAVLCHSFHTCNYTIRFDSAAVTWTMPIVQA